MSTPTYTLINQITLAAASVDVTFTSIPQGYKDLIIMASLRNMWPGSTEDIVQLQFNGDVGSNYSWIQMWGNGSTPNSTSGTGTNTVLGRMNESQTPAGQFSPNVFQIFDYSAIDKHKTALGRASVPGFRAQASAGRWSNTSAITSVRIFNSGASLAPGCILSLYGIVG